MGSLFSRKWSGALNFYILIPLYDQASHFVSRLWPSDFRLLLKVFNLGYIFWTKGDSNGFWNFTCTWRIFHYGTSLLIWWPWTSAYFQKTLSLSMCQGEWDFDILSLIYYHDLYPSDLDFRCWPTFLVNNKGYRLYGVNGCLVWNFYVIYCSFFIL
jgi:hypothetical protein